MVNDRAGIRCEPGHTVKVVPTSVNAHTMAARHIRLWGRCSGRETGFAHVRDDCGGDRTWYRWQHVFGDVLII